MFEQGYVEYEGVLRGGAADGRTRWGWVRRDRGVDDGGCWGKLRIGRRV